MHIEGLFGLLALGTVLFGLQMFLKRNALDIPMVLGGIVCWVAAGYGFFKLAFGT